ncbi:hypothetical protein MSG28_005878 [Choristoneura fumiferana]|uniref:Uncharacterized protein n=2 Tax=Choristoneura fumiferana TaxID=7141 RepID=A0ACC0L0P7_CHOFU|nr:hypothetical protein MSG28_005878 [Choristoneura fumiferana]KAI8442353.1 hypothetical protein MSG28_005878 [Choristoneura fumiferana]
MAAGNKMQPLKFDQICRACLQIKKDMRPLFEQLTATMLMGISKVQVAVGDGLPAQLCLQCVHQISRCHAFKDLVERNDVTLREHAKLAAEEARKNEVDSCAANKDDAALNSDEENYLQLVVFQTTSSVAPGRHVCNLCHKEFKHARWLKLHMRSHTNWIKANCKKPPMVPAC